MRDVKDESTGELMRLEETLLEAARAAKQAVSVRRRLRTLGRMDGSDDDDAEQRGADATLHGADGPDGAAHKASPSSVRDFVDENRVEWRVWEVIPGQSRASGRAEHHNQLGDYQAGWLAFEAVSTGQRRRLRDYPANWNALSNDDLERLLARADAVRSARRLSTRSDQSDAPHP
ncbi:MAG TPA: hypothetical protein VFJ74_01850 [Gemmatimonadaceae bacterium]|nr:hypothetical protein [Gemmatimonadaceae bacterium]